MDSLLSDIIVSINFDSLEEGARPAFIPLSEEADWLGVSTAL